MIVLCVFYRSFVSNVLHYFEVVLAGEGIKISRLEDREERTAKSQDCFMKTKSAATSGAKRKLTLDIKYAQPAAPKPPSRLPASSNV